MIEVTARTRNDGKNREVKLGLPDRPVSGELLSVRVGDTDQFLEVQQVILSRTAVEVWVDSSDYSPVELDAVFKALATPISPGA